MLLGRGVAEQVLQFGTALGADIGTHGSRGSERLVLGSEADRILRLADVPVLVGPLQAR